MRLKQPYVRSLFPKHTVVFSPGEILFYAKADKKKENVVARLVEKVNDRLTILVPMGKMQKLLPFANFNFLKGGRKEIRKGLENAADGHPVSESMIDTAVSARENQQSDVALKMLAAHFDAGVDVPMLEYLTAAAKNEFHYTGTKKPRAKVAAETATKPARKPRMQKVTEGQALLAMAGASFDANGRMSTKADKPAAKAPRKPRAESPAKATGRTKANEAVPTAGKWTEADDATYAGLLDDVRKLTGRLAQLDTARKRGISIIEYDARAKARRASK